MNILIRRGQSANLPSLTLKQGELAFALDTGKLYAGNGMGKVLLNPDITPLVKEELDEAERRHLEHVGLYSITPISGDLSCELRIVFPVQSVQFGYYALAVDGGVYTEAVPVNQPIMTNWDAFKSGRVSLVFYSLRDIVTEDWAPLSRMSLESLLNLKCYEVSPESPVSLELGIEKTAELAGVEYGRLRRIL